MDEVISLFTFIFTHSHWPHATWNKYVILFLYSLIPAATKKKEKTQKTKRKEKSRNKFEILAVTI